MPLKRCTNAEGKKGWSWGNGGCQVAGSDLESKKQAIRVGLKVEGPARFKKIMDREGSKAFAGYEGLQMAKAIYLESNQRGRSDEIMYGIATYFNKSKADGENSTGIDRGTMLDDKKHAHDEKHAEYIDNAGNFSGNPQKTGDGMGTDVADTDNPMFNGPPITANDDRRFGMDGDEQNPPHRRKSTTYEKDDADNYNGNMMSMSKKDTDMYGKHPEGMDNDGDEPNPGHTMDTTDPANHNADLSKKRELPGGLTTTPPYNKEASPETEKTPEHPSYPVPTRDDMNSTHGPDTRKKLDTKVQYTTGPAKSNLYQEEEKKAVSPATHENALSHLSETAITYAAEWVFAYIPQKTRDEISEDDFAGPGRSFPIRNQKDVEHAAMLLHHAANPSAVKSKMKSIIKRKGLSEPHSWQSEASTDWEVNPNTKNQKHPEFVENAGNGPM